MSSHNTKPTIFSGYMLCLLDINFKCSLKLVWMETVMAKKLNREAKPCANLQKKSKYMLPKFHAALLIGTFYLTARVNAEVSSLEDVDSRKNEECHLFSGKWMPGTSSPSYANKSCKFVSAHWNCLKNGRPDTGYIFWRWRPHNCDLLPMNSKKFLSSMRDKSLAMIGDSLLRNQMQSLLCLLSEAEMSVPTYHQGKGVKSTTRYFHTYNFTLANYWAPFLVEAKFLSKRKAKVYLDTLERTWTTEYHKHDYVVIAGGPWFSTPMILMENNAVIGCHSCKGEFKELGPFYPYRRALQMAFNYITTSHHKPIVIYRTWSPEHFEYGKWFNGGFCNRTVPYNEGEYTDTPVGRKYYAIDMEEFTKAAVVGSDKGIRMKLLDIYHLSVLRPDGHPGPYMHFHPFDEDKTAKVQNDCLHWCLPGPIDTWNYLMMEMVLNEVDINLKDIS